MGGWMRCVACSGIWDEDPQAAARSRASGSPAVSSRAEDGDARSRCPLRRGSVRRVHGGFPLPSTPSPPPSSIVLNSGSRTLLHTRTHAYARAQIDSQKHAHSTSTDVNSAKRGYKMSSSWSSLKDNSAFLRDSRPWFRNVLWRFEILKVWHAFYYEHCLLWYNSVTSFTISWLQKLSK